MNVSDSSETTRSVSETGFNVIAVFDPVGWRSLRHGGFGSNSLCNYWFKWGHSEIGGLWFTDLLFLLIAILGGTYGRFSVPLGCPLLRPLAGKFHAAFSHEEWVGATMGWFHSQRRWSVWTGLGFHKWVLRLLAAHLRKFCIYILKEN